MRRSRGFTLIELLVVITIVLIVSAVTLPAIVPAMSHRQVSEAARLVHGTLVGARDKAVYNNAPSGIRLLSDPALLSYLPSGRVDPAAILACNRIIPMDPAPDYSEGRVSTFTVPLPTAGFAVPYPGPGGGFYPPGTLLLADATYDFGVAPAQPLPPVNWFWNVRVGDKIQINNAGPWYTVVGPMNVTPAMGNTEMFVNVGPPAPNRNSATPLVLPGPHGSYYPDFLLLVNGQDDNNNGWVDEGWDGVDNNGNGFPDELLEWEPESWQGSLATRAVTAASYTIRRRPAPSTNAREVALPSNVVIDLTGWALASPERSRVPAGAFNAYTGYVDIMVNPDGSLVPTTIYSSPSSFGIGAAFVHLWIAERGDLAALSGTRPAAPFLPLPRGLAPGLFNGQEIDGEYRLVTLFTRSGQISINETMPFDNPLNPVNPTFGYNASLPFLQAQQGVTGQ